MKADEAITGVVVVYNTKGIIQKMIASVRKFHPTMKLIIVDGSDIKNDCYKYVCGIPDENTRVFHVNENIGHGKGLALGISYVDTPYFITMDSDIEMIKSPLQDMLDMMEESTYGVGYFEPVDIQGHDFGVNKDLVQYGKVKYMHPYFSLIQLKEYNKYEPFIHHGAPAINMMLDLHRRGLSDKVLKEFPGLGHTSGNPINNVDTWKSGPREFIKHDRDGTRVNIKGDWGKVIPFKNRITCITPTGDRAEAFALTRKWIASQTIKPDQWLVIDDGRVPLPEKLREGVQYVRREPQVGEKHTLTMNMKIAFPLIEGDIILIIEDDDWYGEKYIETMYNYLQTYKLVGEGCARYYHLPSMKYVRLENKEHASFCQTGFTKDLLPVFKLSIPGDPYIDMRFWLQFAKGNGYLFYDTNDDLHLHCSLKGLNGRTGIGTGHDYRSKYYKNDSNCRMLIKWVGKENAEIYLKHIGKSLSQFSDQIVIEQQQPVTRKPRPIPCRERGLLFR